MPIVKRSSLASSSSGLSRISHRPKPFGWVVVSPLLAIALSGLLAGCGGGSNGGNLAAPTPGIVTTVAGTGAGFANAANVALDVQGNALVCDFDNDRIARVTPAGITTTFTQQSNFSRPFGIAVAANGTIYVETDGDDNGNRDGTTGTLWRVDSKTGVATVIARDLGRPRGLAVLPNNQVVLVDLNNNDVRTINPVNGAISPLAGSRGTAGFANGAGANALFSRPYGPAITPAGNILLADQTNNCIRMITPAGVVTTFAGDGTAGFVNGPRAAARFNGPQDVDVDAAGNVYVADTGNARVRRIGTDGQVTTLAGSGVKGYADGNASTARFYGLEGLAMDRGSNSVLVADGNGGDGSAFNHLRRINLP